MLKDALTPQARLDFTLVDQVNQLVSALKRCAATSCGRRASRRVYQREDAPKCSGRGGGLLEAAAPT